MMDDLISRAGALDAIDGMKPMRGNMEQLAMKALCWAAVKSIPAVDAVPVRHGHWIYKRGCWAECSECHHDFNDVYDLENSDHYCRHCGAKMDGDA